MIALPDRSKGLRLLLLILSILNFAYVVFEVQSHLTHRNLGVEKSYTYRGHDFPEELPLPSTVELVPMQTEETVHYLPLGNTSDQAWLSLSSAGYGYVRLGPEDRTFVVTMFHELHCLRMLNRAFTKSSGATPEHLKHCLNYIRQGILCSPDLALEPGNFEEKDFAFERSGGVHTCKDWGPIYQFMDVNFYEWSKRTGYVDPVGKAGHGIH